jgi:predicted membrane GTPase involved in stress response
MRPLLTRIVARVPAPCGGDLAAQPLRMEVNGIQTDSYVGRVVSALVLRWYLANRQVLAICGPSSE